MTHLKDAMSVIPRVHLHFPKGISEWCFCLPASTKSPSKAGLSRDLADFGQAGSFPEQIKPPSGGFSFCQVGVRKSQAQSSIIVCKCDRF